MKSNLQNQMKISNLNENFRVKIYKTLVKILSKKHLVNK